jgi:lysophospholipid acyltransferase (LPLAT)-like uncharacterized protein
VPKFLKEKILGAAAGAVYTLLSATWRYRLHFLDSAPPVDFRLKNPDRSSIFAHWHGDELALIGFCRHSKVLTFASESRDGTIMATALKSMGFHIIRGSSTRGGTRALVSMLKELKKDHYYVSFAIDGPNGPRHKAKPGIHLIAYKSGLPIYQCLVHCRRKWDFPNSWNKTYLPKPFAAISLYFYCISQSTKDNREEVLQALNSRTEIDPTVEDI